MKGSLICIQTSLVVNIMYDMSNFSYSQSIIELYLFIKNQDKRICRKLNILQNGAC